MKKRKKENKDASALSDEVIEGGSRSEDASDQGGNKSKKEFPPLPVSDATAAGLIAVVFAVIGAVIAMKAASQDKEPKQKKPKKPKKAKKEKTA